MISSTLPSPGALFFKIKFRRNQPVKSHKVDKNWEFLCRINEKLNTHTHGKKQLHFSPKASVFGLQFYLISLLSLQHLTSSLSLKLQCNITREWSTFKNASFLVFPITHLHGEKKSTRSSTQYKYSLWPQFPSVFSWPTKTASHRCRVVSLYAMLVRALCLDVLEKGCLCNRVAVFS